MKKYYEGSSAPCIHNRSLIVIRLFPHHLLSLSLFSAGLPVIISLPHVHAHDVWMSKIMSELPALRKYELVNPLFAYSHMYCMCIFTK